MQKCTEKWEGRLHQPPASKGVGLGSSAIQVQVFIKMEERKIKQVTSLCGRKPNGPIILGFADVSGQQANVSSNRDGGTNQTQPPSWKSAVDELSVSVSSKTRANSANY